MACRLFVCGAYLTYFPLKLMLTTGLRGGKEELSVMTAFKISGSTAGVQELDLRYMP